MEHVLGIDLGTSHASVACVVDGAATLIPDESSRVLTSSTVAFPSGGQPMVGADAKRRRLSDPGRTIHSLTRLLGREFRDPSVEEFARQVAFPILAGPSGKACVRLGEHGHSPSEVAAAIFANLKARAEAFLGAPCRKAVLVAPALFTDPQRLALRLAAQIAGLEVVRILNQPSAALLVHTHGGNLRRRVAVYSFGGGAFDVTVAEVDGPLIQVLASAGDTTLGGDAFDAHLHQHLRSRFQERHGLDLAGDVVAGQRLLGAAESAKIHLTENQTVEVRLREMAYANGAPVDLVDEVTRKDLHAGCQDVVRRTLAHAAQALEAAGVAVGTLDDVLVTGGSTRVPLVQESVARFFQRQPLLDLQDDGIPARGAALYGAGLLTRKGGARSPLRSLVMDVLTRPLSVHANGRTEKLLPAGVPLPAAVRRTVTTAQAGQQTASLQFSQGEGDAQVRLGQLVVEGLPQAPAGVPTLDTVMEVDPDGILTAAVTDATTGQRTFAAVRVGAEALEQDVVLLRMERGEVRA